MKPTHTHTLIHRYRNHLKRTSERWEGLKLEEGGRRLLNIECQVLYVYVGVCVCGGMRSLGLNLHTRTYMLKFVLQGRVAAAAAAVPCWEGFRSAAV